MCYNIIRQKIRLFHQAYPWAIYNIKIISITDYFLFFAENPAEQDSLFLSELIYEISQLEFCICARNKICFFSRVLSKVL